MLRVKIIIWFLIINVGLAAQNTGLRCSDAKYQTLPLLPSYSGAKYNEVPLRVSLKKYCPVPGDQKQMGTCVGWAVGYGALTILRAQKAGMTDPSEITELAHSAAFIYNQVKLKTDDCTTGVYIEDALTLLKTSGDCLEKSFNYQKTDCRALPEKTQLEEASRYRIQDYAAVFTTEEAPKSKISKACKVLATQTPMVVGIAVTPDFWEIKPGTQVWNPVDDVTATSFHAMTLVGYDNVEKQFELLNSFGTSWGRNGFIRIPYDDFERLCRYAYVLMPDFTKKSEIVAMETALASDNSAAALSGEFVFRKPAGYLTTSEGEEVPFFEEVATQWNSDLGIYTTQKPYFEVGDVFQLVAREIPRGRYAYVFSQSPGGKVNLHFPKILAAGKTAGFVLEKTAEIVIPNEETVLQLPTPGADYLCILYSNVAIDDIEIRLEKLQRSTMDFPERVATIFQDISIPKAQVRFSENIMAFNALPKGGSQQTAVPLILKVEAK